MVRIILVRHGESVANTQDLLGDPVDSPLTDLGKKQAAEAGKYLADNYKIKKIYYSPLVRAADTAKLINKSVKASIVEYSEIREFEDGPDLVGIPRSDILKVPNGAALKKLIEEFDKFTSSDVGKKNSKFHEYDKKVFELTGTEPPSSMKKRCRLVFNEMKKKYPGNGDILLVSHAGFIHEFIANIFNICPQNIGNKYGKYKNCSITSIEVDGKTRPYLELMLYTKYLDGI